MVARFGTDGVRGVANEVITAELALSVGRAAARHFAATEVVIGRDTRRSGSMLESAAAAGICAEGADATLLGVVPTPAVAAACAHRSVPGIVISASHNPFEDNGLKVFAPGGSKLSDAEQASIEEIIDEALGVDAPGPTGVRVGTVGHDDTALGHYQSLIEQSLEGRDLTGVSVVLDAANGANHLAAPALFERLGAQVRSIAVEPDGTNINDGCGSTDPTGLAAAVLDEGADLGIAFDGDADRMLAVDHRGQLVDGDRIIALCAIDLRARGRLRGDTVVVTVMSNLGFHRAMEREGIAAVQTAVGDRNVLEALAAGGFSLGGEQSGHIVFADLSTTGDGLLAAVTLVDLVKRSGRTLAELSAEVMTSVPQVLTNVAVAAPMPDVADRLGGRLDDVARRLGRTGRVLVRPSGTEPVVRVMVEAEDEQVALEVAGELAAAVAELSGG